MVTPFKINKYKGVTGGKGTMVEIKTKANPSLVWVSFCFYFIFNLFKIDLFKIVRNII